MRSLRKALQFTQQEMALLLGVLRSTITMYETGQRELTFAASSLEIRLMECYTSVCNNKYEQDDEPQNKTALAAFKKELIYQVEKSVHEIEEYKNMLKQMKADHLQLQIKQATLKELKNRLEMDILKMKPASNELNEAQKRIRHLEHFEDEASALLKNYGLARQLEVQYRLECRRAQKSAAEKILKQAI